MHVGSDTLARWRIDSADMSTARSLHQTCSMCPPVAAQAACDTLAKLGTCFSLDYWALCHASFSLVKVVRRGQRDKNDESLPMDVLDESSQAYIKATCSNFNRVDNGFLILRSPSPRLG